ncbi:hypothetical protein AVDCRST_MAG84-152 [uncultured Microcoleus sp.]|uniref:Uncharacterized protein n=1 Tax=uncultured Microcoleus sp. TaxID=259945 RepID=A0A6J4KC40_9CYAN|nr:hypothetical protein AVDCRST_MAG84-152 [uncultured Microcoleus sp.]
MTNDYQGLEKGHTIAFFLGTAMRFCHLAELQSNWFVVKA